MNEISTEGQGAASAPLVSSTRERGAVSSAAPRDAADYLPCGAWSHRPEEVCEVCMDLDCGCLPSIHTGSHAAHMDRLDHAANRRILEQAKIAIFRWSGTDRFVAGSLLHEFAQAELRRFALKQVPRASAAGGAP